MNDVLYREEESMDALDNDDCTDIIWNETNN